MISISSFYPKVFQESVRVGCETASRTAWKHVKGGSPHPPRDKGRALQVIENMVDMVGIEPTTSSMPWHEENDDLVTAKDLIAGLA